MDATPLATIAGIALIAAMGVAPLASAPVAFAQVYPPPPPDLGPPPSLPAPSQLTAPSLAPPPPSTLPPLAPPPRATLLQPPPATLTQSPTGARPGNVIGTGQSLPTSGQSSNITPGDTSSVIAPRLPEPPLDENAPPVAFLSAARKALIAGRTGEGQEALERAESRALGRAVRPSQANQPSRQPLVRQITQARDALASGDSARAIQLIDDAMGNPEARQR